MADKTKIEWTDATWNPVTGCQVESPGCKFCYAMKLAGTRLKHHPSRAGLTVDTKNGPVWNGEVRFNEAWLDQPLRWSKPRMIFVCAHADLFYEEVPDEWIDRVFAIMALASRHTFQVLTKRPDRMLGYMRSPDRSAKWCAAARSLGIALRPGTIVDPLAWGRLPNVWLGSSVEDQERADERREPMRQLAEMGWLTWVSYEPALEIVDWTGWQFTRWMVSGGESDTDGESARPSHPQCHRGARDFCVRHDIPYLFKQWGAWLPGQNEPYDGFGDGRNVAHHQDGSWGPQEARNPARNYVMWDREGRLYQGDMSSHSGYFQVAAWARRVGKKAAGRLLDGRTHDDYPSVDRTARDATDSSARRPGASGGGRDSSQVPA